MVPARGRASETEYAVVLGMITLAVVAAFTALSGGVSGAITTTMVAV